MRLALRLPQSVLARISLFALGCSGLLGLLSAFVLSEVKPDLLGLLYGVAAFACVGIALVGPRWTLALAVLPCAPALPIGLPVLLYDLTRRSRIDNIAFDLAILACALVATVAGPLAALPSKRAMPRSPWPALMLLGGLCLGTFGVAALPTTGATGLGASAEFVAGLPALAATGQYRFDQSEVRAHVGELVAIRLENSSGYGHSFDIDELGVHVAMPNNETQVAMFRAAQPGHYTFYCAVPTHRAGGMVGSLVIQP